MILCYTIPTTGIILYSTMLQLRAVEVRRGHPSGASHGHPASAGAAGGDPPLSLRGLFSYKCMFTYVCLCLY